MTTCRATFTLKDGRVLACEYGVHVTPGCHTLSNGDPGYPDEIDVGDPVFTLDDCPIEESELPKGLDKIANRLYLAGPGEFGYSESDDYHDIEPDEPDYLFGEDY